MSNVIKYPKIFFVIFLIGISAVIGTRCINNVNQKEQLSRASFTGPDKCADCHKAISDAHFNTTHNLTSAIANQSTIKGDFTDGNNEFHFNDRVKVTMEKRGEKYFQVAYVGGVEKNARPFEITVGSATKGQTYLFWNNNNLFQLPITYFTSENQWGNSPGFPGKVIYDRPVTMRCLECHTTYAEGKTGDSGKPDEVNRNTLIYGVTCEKCHGPGAEHVNWHSDHPKEKQAKFISNPAKFTRSQSLDLCALCHGGRMQKTTESFSFETGKNLADYFKRDTSYKAVSNIDVHGNQLGLLSLSKCFKVSKSMTCSTCHNSHDDENDKLALFSSRCVTCHTKEHSTTCKMTETLGNVINSNCIDCHMPFEKSQGIIMMLQGKEFPVPAQMRTHNINKYPGATKKYIEQIKGLN